MFELETHAALQAQGNHLGGMKLTLAHPQYPIPKL